MRLWKINKSLERILLGCTCQDDVQSRFYLHIKNANISLKKGDEEATEYWHNFQWFYFNQLSKHISEWNHQFTEHMSHVNAERVQHFNAHFRFFINLACKKWIENHLSEMSWVSNTFNPFIRQTRWDLIAHEAMP